MSDPKSVAFALQNHPRWVWPSYPDNCRMHLNMRDSHGLRTSSRSTQSAPWPKPEDEWLDLTGVHNVGFLLQHLNSALPDGCEVRMRRGIVHCVDSIETTLFTSSNHLPLGLAEALLWAWGLGLESGNLPQEG